MKRPVQIRARDTIDCCSRYATIAFAIVALGLAHASAVAQDGTEYSFSGTVTDSSDDHPVVGASVALPQLRRGAIVRPDGGFVIDHVRSGVYEVVVQSIGHQVKRFEITIDRNTRRDIVLVPSVVSTDEVVITATSGRSGLTGSSQSITEIDPSTIENTRGATLGESLKQVAGVTLLQTGPSIAKPVIRGLHSQRVLIVNAGVAQEGQQWGAEHAPEIDPFAPAHIEVLRGAAGVEFGAGAIGGVIQVTPLPLRDSPGINGRISLNGFSNNLQGSGAIELEGKSSLVPGAGIRLQGSMRRAGDARAANYGLGNTGFEELDGAMTVDFDHGPFGANLYVSHFGTTIGIFRGSHINNAADLLAAIAAGHPLGTYPFSYRIDAPKQEISHNMLAVGAHYHLPSIGRIDLRYGLQQNDRQEFDAHNARIANDTGGILRQRASFGLTLTTHSLNVKLLHNPIGNLTGTIGIDGTRQGNVRAGAITLIPNFRSYSGGIYWIENLDLGELLLNAGARYDYEYLHVYPIASKNIMEGTREFGNVTGSIGANYHLAQEWSVSLNIGSAWRPPSVNELYSNDIHHGSAQFEIGDFNLIKERNYSVDATLKHAGELSSGELSIYNNYFDGFIYLLPDPEPTVTIRGAYPTFRYMQSRAVLRGLDATFNYQILDSLTLGSTLSIVRGENLDKGEPLIQIPSDRLRLSARYDFDLGGSRINAPFVELASQIVRRQDRFPRDVDYAPPPPGYVLFDVNSGVGLRVFGQLLNISLSVQNVLNASYRDYLSRYRYFSDDPGRNVVLRMGIPFGSLPGR